MWMHSIEVNFKLIESNVNIKTFGGFCAQELTYIHLEVIIWGFTSHWKSQSTEQFQKL